MLETLVSVEKAIEISGLSRSTLWRLEKEGKIKSNQMESEEDVLSERC